MNRRPLAAAIGLLLVVSASVCGTAQDLTRVPSTLAPVGADEIVWQVTDGPGFTSMEVAYALQPRITVYGDGRVIVVPEDASGFDGLPVVQLAQGRLSTAQVDQLRREALSTGLFSTHPPDLGTPSVSDSGTTTVRTVDASGRRVAISAYALGSGADGASGVTAHQRDQRHDLARLVTTSLSLVGQTKGYTPTRLMAIDLSGGGSSPTGQAAPWPGPTHRDLFGGQQGDPACSGIPQRDTADVYAAALSNPDLTWRDDAGRFHALVKVVLPGEEPCDL